MLTLNAKLIGLDDEKLLPRIVEIWGNFFDQILPYIEGVLLPVHTDKLLLSLHRPSKPTRPSSPSHPESTPATVQIDVRTLALYSFRDFIILPIRERLLDRLGAPPRDTFSDSPEHLQPRLQQMLLVLASTTNCSMSHNLTSMQQHHPGELTVAELLRAVRKPTHAVQHPHSDITQLPSFLSGGASRDRRGRIARKSLHIKSSSLGTGTNGDGNETPRTGIDDSARKREREFLASLRSPGMEEHRTSLGGWGLGVGLEETTKDEEEEDAEDKESPKQEETGVGADVSIPNYTSAHLFKK